MQASHSNWVTQVCPWTFRKAIRPLYWTLSFADTNSGVRVNWGLGRKLHVLPQCAGLGTRGDAGSIFTMKLFVSNARTHNRCELLCYLIMTNKLNVLMSSEHSWKAWTHMIRELLLSHNCDMFMIHFLYVINPFKYQYVFMFLSKLSIHYHYPSPSHMET